VQLGRLGTSATSWPIVPAKGDYEDRELGGMIIDRGNRSTRRKPAPVPLCPPQISHDLTGRELGTKIILYYIILYYIILYIYDLFQNPAYI
jgi:hypothetical protein